MHPNRIFGLDSARKNSRHETEADYKIVDLQMCGLLAESFMRLGKQATIQKHYITRRLGALGPGEIAGLKSILRKMFSL